MLACMPLQRLERIRRNQEMLKQMGIQQMAQDLATTAQQQHEGAGAGGLRQSRPKEVRSTRAWASRIS